MHRRTFLRSTGAIGAVGGLAGCLGSAGLGDSNPDVALGEPDREFESSDVPYPAWGEQIPDVTVPAPLENRQVSIRTVGKPRLLTFIYTSCPSVCPVLTSTMRNVQTHALNNGYGDRVEFFPLTFDPARDTADRLRQYAEKMNVDADAGNWHFLRPQSKERAKQVIQQQFGVAFQKQSPTPSTESSQNQTESGDGHHHGTERGDGHHHDHGEYKFTHMSMMLLVNADGFVERAHRSKSPDEEAIISDIKTVRNA